ncbi:MAG TPA: DUF4124 domain-containing protein [Gammaproteobacteria bacterium]|nr:DUF4124 domain-containing protein [Gammaproteobacteria bacterium]
MMPEKPSSNTPRRATATGPALAIAAALGVLLSAAPPPGHAQIYRWVDGNGLTHFSQTPPPSGEYRQIQPPPPPAQDPHKAQDRINKVNQHFQDQLKAEQKQAQQDHKDRKDRKRQAQRCHRAKKRLTALTVRPHILVKTGDGHTRRMTEPQRQADITATKARIAQYCPG